MYGSSLYYANTKGFVDHRPSTRALASGRKERVRERQSLIWLSFNLKGFNMFGGSQANILDLSSFDTSKVTDIGGMFYNAKATIGYARTQADADRFNASAGKPAGLVFVIKGT